MELKDVITRRRSIRKYKNEQVSTDLLLEISDLSLNAPSAGNMKACQLVIINEKSTIEKVKRFSPGMGFIPPALIVIGINLQKALSKAGTMAKKEFIYYDAAIVAYNICLLASEYNLGSCILASFNRDAIGKFVNFSDEICPILMVSIGYPLKEPVKLISEDKSNMIFLQKYENR